MISALIIYLCKYFPDSLFNNIQKSNAPNMNCIDPNTKQSAARVSRKAKALLKEKISPGRYNNFIKKSNKQKYKENFLLQNYCIFDQNLLISYS